MPCQPVSTVPGRGWRGASDITSSSPSPPYYISSARPAPAVMCVCVCKPKASETSITSVGRFLGGRDGGRGRELDADKSQLFFGFDHLKSLSDNGCVDGCEEAKAYEGLA
ncbi:hypothetical protein NPIL_402891 [Nephila pilipes]|uniref:Uncharacterized protein n=1 Tax=Nephila pilipes TaxID=299642 RepID=A0A8X6NFK5_NEPPI|nr:hypothetical protein NPIL_402891 [Nephila pilipes]